MTQWHKALKTVTYTIFRIYNLVSNSDIVPFSTKRKLFFFSLSFQLSNYIVKLKLSWFKFTYKNVNFSTILHLETFQENIHIQNWFANNLVWLSKNDENPVNIALRYHTFWTSWVKNVNWAMIFILFISPSW